jgi:hypothetical protein
MRAFYVNVWYLPCRKLSPESKWRLGLRDLTHPNPKRTQVFLTVLQNFWLFYSQIYESLMQVNIILS